jgi:hypothetical protein
MTKIENKNKDIVSAVSIVCCIVFCIMSFYSCKTAPHVPVPLSRLIEARGMLSSDELTSFFLSQKPDADRVFVRRLAGYYVTEASDEGINSDVAFAQMCLETGWLSFGNLVTSDMHNYCGLGAIDEPHSGEHFETEELGVRAHIQHLHAYGTKTGELIHPLIDKRYKWVQPRGKAPTVFDLAGTWAGDKLYGKKLDALLSKMEFFEK